jgi:diacylglycerol kinase family enzyme
VPIYEQRVAPLLEYAGIAADVTVTDHAGHAIEIGKAYDPARYEGAVFIGGDGTVQEFLSGLLSRRDWRMVVRRTPLCSIACGTQNALARGVRTPLPEYATVRRGEATRKAKGDD